jgi:hypothetical protein
MPSTPYSFARLHSGHLVWVESVDADVAHVVILEQHPPQVVAVPAGDLVAGAAPHRTIPAPAALPVVAIEPEAAG